MSTAKSTLAEPSPADVARRAGLLEASLAVFARFGFRKTSMEEVARAAQISRQGLYLHFSNKEELFRATVSHACAASLADALKALEAEGPLPERLTTAFDQWVGRYVGQFGADAADLMEAAETLAGTLIKDHEKLFIDAITAALREGGLTAAYKPAGVTARQLAENLAATAGGLKHHSETREEFQAGIAVAVRITCAPLARQ
jgi:TetR/AcrR family transcriptional regulator of autoinduction and epiphytic fitness